MLRTSSFNKNYIYIFRKLKLSKRICHFMFNDNAQFNCLLFKNKNLLLSSDNSAIVVDNASSSKFVFAPVGIQSELLSRS